MEANQCRKTLQEIDRDHAIHPNPGDASEKQMLEGAASCVAEAKQQRQGGCTGQEAELFQQIGRLQMELRWLKKFSAACDARELRKGCVDPRSPLRSSITRQCEQPGLGLATD